MELMKSVKKGEDQLTWSKIDDGTDDIKTQDEERFLNWLKKNGAKIDKVEWPSRNTVSGVRGAVAMKDIEPYEPMLEIPLECIIYPKVCFDCPELKPVYEENATFFTSDDDIVIALFLMHESLKGAESYWFPYIAILPRPGGIGEWTHEEQMLLQDRSLIGEARRRPNQLRMTYTRVLKCLINHDPERFSEEKYSFDLFSWAWMIVQSRAFGRRLEYTAMVPFADCLNHTNVQTKYDMISTSDSDEREEEKDRGSDEEVVQDMIGGKTYFRLYPSGKNRYRKGTEAFNSYGRRSNRFLLLEYGFCLENNEWDVYDLCARVDSEVDNYHAKCDLLRNFGLSRVKLFKLGRKHIDRELLGFLRLAYLPDSVLKSIYAPDVNHLETEGGDEENPSRKTVMKRLSMIWFQPVSKEHEVEVLEAALGLVEKEIATQPTSLQDDELELEQGKQTLPPRTVAALIYRIGRKSILESQKQLIQKQIEMLNIQHD